MSLADSTQGLRFAEGGAPSAAEDLGQRLEQLNAIGASLSAERDIDRLLEAILTAAKTITRADGGTLYRVAADDTLRFEIVRTSSLKYYLGGTTGTPVPFYPIQLHKDGKPNHNMVAAYAALTGKTVNIADAYTADGFDFSGTRAFDSKTGYRSKSFLTVPMRNHEREIIGVLQLINAQDPQSGEIVAFSASDQRLAESLASQAAIALTNRMLIIQLEQLFESFINLINSAIDEKSPYTGGHCQRVPVLTMLLAEAVNETRAGPLSDFSMSEKDRYELKIAGLLHDCGKVTTPVHVVDKATKLETLYNRIHEVRTRFEVLKRDAEIHCLQGIVNGGDEATCRHNLAKTLAELDEDFAFVARCNLGSEAMVPEDQQRLLEVAQRTWQRTLDNRLGLSQLELQRHPQDVALPLPVTESVLADKPEHRLERPAHDQMPKDDRWGFRMAEPKLLYNQGELYNLRVGYGTLTEEERFKINQHIVQTEVMLRQLPFPPYLSNVPEIAAGHHEKLDGTGYPKGLHQEQLRPETRMLAIADIFEALTASDRPYKKAKQLSEAIEILNRMSQRGHIDPALFALFLSSGVYKAYAERFMEPSQIDEVPVTRYLASIEQVRTDQRADVAAARTLASSST